MPPRTALILALTGSLLAQEATEATAEGESAAAPAYYLQHREDIAAAAERGLSWLAERQLPGGCWTGAVGHKRGDDYLLLPETPSVAEQRARDRGHLGVSSLCGLAFLAGGHLPGRGRYGDEVRRTLEYVLSCVHDDGLLRDSGTRMYSHAFATLYLAEVYGMAGGDRTRNALEKAVHLIVDCQNDHGAWRYNPFSREADLSVTVCQLQSLRAARNIGIRVPGETVEHATRYVRRSITSRGRHAGLFYYKIVGRGAYRKNTEYAINAAGLTALYSAGVYDDELTEPVLSWLDQEYAFVSDYYADHYYYWYGNYYAAQAFFQSGGPRFRSWYGRIARDLRRRQQPDGRWRNRVGPGDEFATAVACLVLQIPTQYLPIFQR